MNLYRKKLSQITTFKSYTVSDNKHGQLNLLYLTPKRNPYFLLKIIALKKNLCELKDNKTISN